jgi:drug/metabolite transporter (DMT)-like permease
MSQNSAKITATEAAAPPGLTDMSRQTWGLFLALGVIWGMPYLLIRIAVEDLDPLIVAFARTTLGALMLLPFVWRGGAFSLTPKQWNWLALYTLAEISGPWLLIGHAETRLNSSTAGLIIATTPLIAATIVVKLGHERIDLRRGAGLALGLFGVGALLGLDIEINDFPAAAALVLSALGYAIGPIIITRKLDGVPPMVVVAGSLVIAALLYLPFVPFNWPETITADAAWSVLGLAALCTALAFVLFMKLVAQAGPARATVITYLNPAVAIVLGVLVLNEPLTPGMAIGFPLIILGSVLGTSAARPKTSAPVAAAPDPAPVKRAVPARRAAPVKQG